MTFSPERRDPVPTAYTQRVVPFSEPVKLLRDLAWDGRTRDVFWGEACQAVRQQVISGLSDVE
jgi:hypothetical protein